MSQVHYFQRYSQRENVVTNNTLLLFSRLYSYSPLRFNDFLSEILGKSLVEVGVKFEQQTKIEKGSVPDGLMAQQSFRIVIETKLYKTHDLDQLSGHLSAFGGEEIQALLLLSPMEPDHDFKTKAEALIRNFNRKGNKSITLVCTTFEQVISKCDDILEQHDYEMKDLLEDYRSFCSETGLLPRTRYLMRAVNCGLTLDENFELSLYYDPADRSYREHNYIGIYSNKCVRWIGEIENIIAADFIDSALQVIESTYPVADVQRERIIKVIARAQRNNGWDISRGHRFFLVKQFYATEYRKKSSGPMRGTQYFDLGEVLDVSDLPDVLQMAERLKHKSW